MSCVHRAAWVLPIDAPPIRNGWVEVDRGRIVAVGTAAERPPDAGTGSTNGEPPAASGETVAILPGLVNVHTHLELSWMAGRVPPSDSMGGWIRELMALRRSELPGVDEQGRAAGRALASARATGTVAIGDIGNSFVAIDVLADAGMPSVMFHELIGFRLGHDDARVRADEGVKAVLGAVRMPVKAGLAPHAPYSVSPDLFRAVADAASAHGLSSSVHLGESPEEVEFLMTGRGGIAETLKHLGAWNDAWTIPGQDPVDYLDSLGVLRPGLLTVHCARLTPSALKRLAGRGCVLVSCPRSNRWVGAGDPSSRFFLRVGSRRSVRDRQPGQRRRPEYVRGTGGRPGRVGGSGGKVARERDPPRRRGPRFWQGSGHYRARQARGPPRRADSGRYRRCGRISGERRGCRRYPLAATVNSNPDP